MPERIFALPERADDRASIIRWQTDAARVIEAVPSDWSDVSGELVPSSEDGVCESTGYAFHRFDRTVHVTARPDPRRPDAVVRPDPVAVLLSGALPRFVSFHHTGFDADWQFLTARSLAAGFVRRGYVGWLAFNNGRRREHAHEIPAEVELRLSCWDQLGIGLRSMPPAVVLRWVEEYGGSREQLAPILHIVQELYREFPLAQGAV